MTEKKCRACGVILEDSDPKFYVDVIIENKLFTWVYCRSCYHSGRPLI